MAGIVRVIVADDHPVYREGIARAIREREDFALVAECDSGVAALRELRRQSPDVALLDLQLPEMTGLEVVRAAQEEEIATNLVLLSAHTDGALVYEAVVSGAAGYLSKAADRHALCDAVAAVARGEQVFSPTLHPGLIDQIRLRGEHQRPELTTREREILALIADGRSTPSIAEQLYVSETTVKTHLRHLYDKLGVSERAAAVAEAMRRGLLK